MAARDFLTNLTRHYGKMNEVYRPTHEGASRQTCVGVNGTRATRSSRSMSSREGHSSGGRCAQPDRRSSTGVPSRVRKAMRLRLIPLHWGFARNGLRPGVLHQSWTARHAAISLRYRVRPSARASRSGMKNLRAKRDNSLVLQSSTRHQGSGFSGAHKSASRDPASICRRRGAVPGVSRGTGVLATVQVRRGNSQWARRWGVRVRAWCPPLIAGRFVRPGR